MERIAGSHLAAIGGTLAETVGTGPRQQLVWLSLLAMPLLFPIAVPGMATMVGAWCLLVALGWWLGRSLPLPGWLGRRELGDRLKAVLVTVVNRVIRVIASVARPRLLALTQPGARMFNAGMLGVAGLAMMVPVPVISFDNVLPALAIVLIAWGLRLRDGLMLMAGHVVALVAAASVALLWWGGAQLVNALLAWAGAYFGG